MKRRRRYRRRHPAESGPARQPEPGAAESGPDPARVVGQVDARLAKLPVVKVEPVESVVETETRIRAADSASKSSGSAAAPGLRPRSEHAFRSWEPVVRRAFMDRPTPQPGSGSREEVPSQAELRGPGKTRDEQMAQIHAPLHADRHLTGNALTDELLQARELEKAGQVDRAMQMYSAILRRNPDNLEAHYALGTLYEKIGQHLQALEQFERAKRVDPENLDIMVHHANAMAVLGRFEIAERELRRAARLDPMRPAIYTSLGIIQFRRGLYAQAEAELRRAIELDPESATAYHYRGESLNQLSRLDEALEMLERAAGLDPSYARTYYVMGIVLDRVRRPNEAAAMFRRARELTPA